MPNVELRLRALLWRLASVAEGGDDPQIVRLDGFADIQAAREQLAGTCRTSLRSLHSHLPHGDQTASAQRTAELVGRGIRMQTVRLRNRLLGPEGASMRGYLRAVVGLGEELRAAERLPVTQMVLADQSAALIPVLGTPMTQAALLIRSEEFVRPLEAVFQSTWEQSEAVDISEADPLERMGERSREVLVLLAAGLTDEAIARELGVTDRTVRRQVAGLCRKLRVECRFQLGLEVARRGLL
jgi:ATP/maltotriose-dependent transcriptional regulator MalT